MVLRNAIFIIHQLIVYFGNNCELTTKFLMAIISIGQLTWPLSLSFVTAILVPTQYIILAFLFVKGFLLKKDKVEFSI